MADRKPTPHRSDIAQQVRRARDATFSGAETLVDKVLRFRDNRSRDCTGGGHSITESLSQRDTRDVQQVADHVTALGAAFVEAIERSGRFTWYGIGQIQDQSPVNSSVICLLERPKSDVNLGAKSPEDLDILPAYRALAKAMRPQSCLDIRYFKGEEFTVETLKQLLAQPTAEGEHVVLVEDNVLMPA